MRWLVVLVLVGAGCNRVLGLAERDPEIPPDADVSCTIDADCVAGAEAGTCTCGHCSYQDAACDGTNLRWAKDALGARSEACIPAIERIASRVYHTCATMTDGTAWCWGENNNGQLGTAQPGLIASSLPVPLRSSAGLMTDLAEVRPGALSTCARKLDGTVVCWGSNLFGELGGAIPPGPDVRSLEPVPVLTADGPLANVTALSMGYFHGCALVAKPGTAEAIWCWGVNNYAQLGDGTSSVRTHAVQVAALPAGDIVQVAAGGDHTCAIVKTTTNHAYCWGRTANGRLGNNVLTDGMQLAPTLVLWRQNSITSPMPDVNRIAIGTRYTCAIKQPNGEFYCWGLNTNGALGDGSVVERPIATKVLGIADGERNLLAADDLHTCGTRATTLSCWGRDDNGEIGNGPVTGNQLMPVAVIPSVQQRDLTAGWNFTCALDTNRQLRCWGSNANGELGIGNTADQASPVEVSKSAFCPAP